jgi:hypothetical protein
MKGPQERLKYDLRRLWECPVCKRRERTAGTVTFRHCACQIQKLDGKPVVMKLVADGVQRLVPMIKPACEIPALGQEIGRESVDAESTQQDDSSTEY